MAWRALVYRLAMEPDALRARLGALLYLSETVEGRLVLGAERRACEGYAERDARLRGPGGDVPALLLLPSQPPPQEWSPFTSTRRSGTWVSPRSPGEPGTRAKRSVRS